MKPEVALELLETAAEQLKVRVSYESLQTAVAHGGLCRVKGEYRIIVDKRATAEERVTTLAAGLAQVVRGIRSATATAAVQVQDGIASPIPPSVPLAELSPKVLELLRMYEPGSRISRGRTAA